MLSRNNTKKSNGNVFADIGLPNSEQELLKAKLLGTTQPQISALMSLSHVSVSVGRLMEFLTILGQDVEVTVRPTQKNKAGHLSVQVGV